MSPTAALTANEASALTQDPILLTKTQSPLMLHIQPASSVTWCVPRQLLLSLCLLSVIGCAPSEKLPPEAAELLLNPEANLDSQTAVMDLEQPNSGPKVEPAPVGDADWIDLARLPWTYAEVHYLRGGRIGYSIMTVSRSDISEFKQLRIQRTDVIDRAPDGTQIPRRQVNYEAFERPNGELASFRFDSQIDGCDAYGSRQIYLAKCS